MEQLLLFVGDWWWTAPAAVALGAVGYGAVTTPRRRARRLELDAARFDEQSARRALLDARTQVRVAQAEVLAARARRDPVLMDQTRAALQAARRSERTASLAVRASRTRVKATATRYHLASAHDPLPLERLMAAHDALTRRWLEYETDAARALAFPQLLDSRHPVTIAFVRAHGEAARLRPASGRSPLTPEAFAAYRDAVRAAELAFDRAERAAHAAAGAPMATAPDTGTTAALLGGAASVLGEAAAALSDVAAALPDRLRTIRWREAFRGPAAPPAPPGPPAQPGPSAPPTPLP